MGWSTSNDASQGTGTEICWRVELDSTFGTPRQLHLPLSCHGAEGSCLKLVKALAVIEEQVKVVTTKSIESVNS